MILRADTSGVEHFDFDQQEISVQAIDLIVGAVEALRWTLDSAANWFDDQLLICSYEFGIRCVKDGRVNSLPIGLQVGKEQL